jgi:hypothetical protein
MSVGAGWLATSTLARHFNLLFVFDRRDGYAALAAALLMNVLFFLWPAAGRRALIRSRG